MTEGTTPSPHCFPRPLAMQSTRRSRRGAPRWRGRWLSRLGIARLLATGARAACASVFFVGAGRLDVSLILLGGRSEARHVSIDLDDSGRGFIPVPWRSLTEIDLMIQNSLTVGGPAEYYFAIDYDPAVPFDLLGFTAETPRRTTLAWSTVGRSGSQGGTSGGPGPLAPSPASTSTWAGDRLDGQPMSYLYLDATAAPAGSILPARGDDPRRIHRALPPTGVRLVDPRAPIASLTRPAGSRTFHVNGVKAVRCKFPEARARCPSPTGRQRFSASPASATTPGKESFARPPPS